MEELQWFGRLPQYNSTPEVILNFVRSNAAIAIKIFAVALPTECSRERVGARMISTRGSRERSIQIAHLADTKGDVTVVFASKAC